MKFGENGNRELRNSEVMFIEETSKPENNEKTRSSFNLTVLRSVKGYLYDSSTMLYVDQATLKS